MLPAPNIPCQPARQPRRAIRALADCEHINVDTLIASTLAAQLDRTSHRFA